jgi:predicted MFS family arabinose efflux permease
VRRLLLLVSSIIFVDAMLFTALTPLIAGYAKEFELSKLGAGLLVGAFGAGALLGGIPGGLAAARFGPRLAVIGGLVLLGLASFAFAAAESAESLAAARFVQGFSSTTTWAGALAWIAVVAPKDRRGAVIGTAFGAAVFGAVLGPIFGWMAGTIDIRASFAAVGVVALAFAGVAARERAAPAEGLTTGGVSRAFRDPWFVGGLWLNTLPAFLFGMLVVLAPLALDDAGWTRGAVALVFFATGFAEAVINPLLGRVSDRVGPLAPIRYALAASVVVAAGLAFAAAPAFIAVLVCAAAVSFGACYTPGMALSSHRADAAGLAQGLAFGIMNSAWALGEMTGPTVGGALGDAFGDAVPYLVGAAACALTLAATTQVAARKARTHAV